MSEVAWNSSGFGFAFFLPSYVGLEHALPETNIARENGPSQMESSLQTKDCSGKCKIWIEGSTTAVVAEGVEAMVENTPYATGTLLATWKLNGLYTMYHSWFRFDTSAGDAKEVCQVTQPIGNTLQYWLGTEVCPWNKCSIEASSCLESEPHSSQLSKCSKAIYLESAALNAEAHENTETKLQVKQLHWANGGERVMMDMLWGEMGIDDVEPECVGCS